MKLFKKILSGLIICVMIFKLPDFHYNYVRNKVGSRVVTVTNKEETHGGTGFHVVAPSGKTYIMTNSHVCEHTQENGMVFVSDEYGHKLPRRVLLDSDFTDLCVVEAMPGAEGLTIGSEPEVGDIVEVVGHPRLLPLTTSRGEIITKTQVEVGDHLIDPENPQDTCSLPKNKIEDMYMFGFIPVKLCTVVVNAYITNTVILPGNSGSPVVNFWGNIVGVVFAGNQDSNWGDFVSLSEVKKMLAPF